MACYKNCFTICNVFKAVLVSFTVSKFFGIIGGVLGKIALPITIILGVIRGLTDFFKGENKGIGSLLKNIFNGLLETFTFGLLDIERIFGFFDQIITTVRKVGIRIANFGVGGGADRLQRRTKKKKKEKQPGDRIAAEVRKLEKQLKKLHLR